MNERAGVTWFLINYDFERFCVFGAHWDLSWTIDGNVFDYDGW